MHNFLPGANPEARNCTFPTKPTKQRSSSLQNLPKFQHTKSLPPRKGCLNLVANFDSRNSIFSRTRRISLPHKSHNLHAQLHKFHSTLKTLKFTDKQEFLRTTRNFRRKNDDGNRKNVQRKLFKTSDWLVRQLMMFLFARCHDVLFLGRVSEKGGDARGKGEKEKKRKQCALFHGWRA